MVSFLAITAATVLIAETTSTGTANGITTTVLRIAVVAVLVAWTVTYSKRHQRRQGERRGGGDAGLPLSKPAPARPAEYE